MKIVFVSKECPPSPRSSGIGTYVWETGKALAIAGHEITIVAAADDGQMSSMTPVENLTVIQLPDDEIDVGNRNIVARTLSGPVAEGIAYRGHVAKCLRELAAQGRAEIVEFCGFRGESYVWLDGPRLPMVVRMHGFTAGVDTGWKKRVSASGRCLHTWELREVMAADVITAVSENQAATVREAFGSERLRVIYNGIDTAWWRGLAGQAEKELGIIDILYAGGLSTKKGVFVLLKAAARLRKKGWQGRLVLAGRAYRDFERYVGLRAAFGRKLPSWVVVLGTCPRERLAGFYRDAGVSCFPSLQDPFPYTCLEAMACGGIVVGTTGTGMAEMLTPDSGFVTTRGDVSSLEAALTAALALTPEERAQMRAAAQKRTAECFDHQVIVPKLISIYQETIELFRSRSAAGTRT